MPPTRGYLRDVTVSGACIVLHGSSGDVEEETCVKKWEEVPGIIDEQVTEVMYQVERETETTEVMRLDLITVEPGVVKRRLAHHDVEQAYIIVKGRGQLHIGEEEQDVLAGVIVCITGNGWH